MDDAAVRLLHLPGTVLLMGSVVLVSLVGWMSRSVQDWLILTPYRVRANGEVHRLLTAGWAHKDLHHIFFNMLSLYLFAGRTTHVLGTPRFLVLYLTAVVVGFLPTQLRHARDPGYSTLGASGAVAAVMFSAVLLYPKDQLRVIFFPIPVPAAVFAAGWLAYSVWHSLSEGDNINHDAHISGALYGTLLTYVFEPTLVERSIRGLLHFAEKVR